MYMYNVRVCVCVCDLLTVSLQLAPNNASRWQMGFNSTFKGLIHTCVFCEGVLISPYSDQE